MLQKSAIITLFIASVLGAISLYGSKLSPVMHSPDHQSTLSHKDYARGHLREKDVICRMTPHMTKELAEKGLKLGSPVFIRIFKESHELEIWIEDAKTKKFKLFKTWKVAAMSGKLGPKLAEGDLQAPEGFYYVAKSQMKPDSKFHLAFNIGYPNSYDRAHAYTGSFIMVHGNRVSAGCFAMTDPGIEEIYTLCSQALTNGQPFFRIHVFPFRMSATRMNHAKGHRWHAFWTNLKEGYDWFEEKKTPPNVALKEKRYVFR